MSELVHFFASQGIMLQLPRDVSFVPAEGYIFGKLSVLPVYIVRSKVVKRLLQDFCKLCGGLLKDMGVPYST